MVPSGPTRNYYVSEGLLMLLLARGLMLLMSQESNRFQKTQSYHPATAMVCISIFEEWKDYMQIDTMVQQQGTVMVRPEMRFTRRSPMGAQRKQQT